MTISSFVSLISFNTEYHELWTINRTEILIHLTIRSFIPVPLCSSTVMLLSMSEAISNQVILATEDCYSLLSLNGWAMHDIVMTHWEKPWAKTSVFLPPLFLLSSQKCWKEFGVNCFIAVDMQLLLDSTFQIYIGRRFLVLFCTGNVSVIHLQLDIGNIWTPPIYKTVADGIMCSYMWFYYVLSHTSKQ